MNGADFLQDVMARMTEDGLAPGDSLQADGGLHRCGVSGKERGKDGAYRVHLDPPASAWWRNWRTGAEGTACCKSDKELTPAERKALRERIEADKAAHKAEQEKRWTAAAKLARSIWNAAPLATDSHEYLERKGVPSIGLRLARDGRLIIPVMDVSGKLRSLQYIAGDGGKLFIQGGKTAGGYLPIPAKDGTKNGPLLIAEGYATAASLHLATGYACLAAFNAGNLEAVARMARALYPERELVLCADFDEPCKQHPERGGTGVALGTRAAQAVGGKLVICPAHEGRAADFNDLHSRRGRDAVRAVIEEAREVRAMETVEDDAHQGETCILPPPPPVPLEAFPPSVAAMLEEAAEAFTVPLQIPAACFLSLLSCLVGRSRLICLKASWKEAGNLWIAVVAQSGMGKSPLISAFFHVVDRLEYEAKKAFDAEYAEYEDILLERQTQRTHNARAKARGKEVDAAPVPILDEPVQRQITADDVTIEALGEILKGNPKGVLWLKDELSGMLFDFDKYSSKGGGGTKARMLSSYDRKRWKTNRASNPKRNIDIPKACVGIFGGIQPGMLTRAFEAGTGGTDEESGFLPRFIFIRAVAEAPAYWNERTFSRSSTELLDAIAAALWPWDVECDAEGREVERRVPVSSQAKALYVRWYDAIAEEAFISRNAALLAKLRGQAQRLCLLLHCLDAALAGSDGMGLVTEDCMRRALLLADWVKEHQEQCWSFFRPEKKVRQTDPVERAVMAVLVENAARIEVDGWRISNARLVEMVNARLPMTVKPEQIGRAATSLGLPPAYIGKERARKIPPETLKSFAATVGTVDTVGKPTDVRADGYRKFKSEPSVTSRLEVPLADSADSSEINRRQPGSLKYQGQPTVPTVIQGGLPDLDFNDPNFPDVVVI